MSDDIKPSNYLCNHASSCPVCKMTNQGLSEHLEELERKIKAHEYAYKLAEERIEFLLKRANEAEK